MKIAILHPSYEDSNAPFKEFDPLCDPSRHLPEHSTRGGWLIVGFPDVVVIFRLFCG